MTIVGWILAAALQEETPEERERSRETLRRLSLSELLDVTITTAARKDQSLSRTPAAVTVLRGEDLRRLGIRALPDALRLVPGASVEQWSSGVWAVALRGFTDRFSNKLQVLLDGRSTYNPLFGGVYWDTQDPFLEDVDRIEVIRGPGASVWGANAVNGVINIITKSSKDTQGAYLSAGAGAEDLQDFAEARWGGRSGEALHYRAYAKYGNWDEQKEGHDDRFQARGGMRLDWNISKETSAGTSLELYDGVVHQETTGANWPFPPAQFTVVHPQTASGGFLSSWWERRYSPQSSLKAELHYEHEDRDRIQARTTLDIASLDLVHRFPLLDFNDVTWGVGYRVVRDEIENSYIVRYDPDRARQDVVSLFLQDEVSVVKDVFSIVLGSKFEHNDHTGFEYQPTGRFSLVAAEGHVIWGAVSRAVHTPTRADDDARIAIATTPAGTVAIVPDDDLRAEELIAYELGYRGLPSDVVTVDVSGYVHQYDGILGLSDPVVYSESEPAPAHTVFGVTRGNTLSGTSYGVETAVTWDILAKTWRLRGTYAFMRIHLDEEDGEPKNPFEATYEGEPRHTATLWSSWTLPWDVEFDLVYRFTDRHRDPDLGSWAELDLRLGWAPVPHFEVGVVGRNLLHDSHRESGQTSSAGINLTEPERNMYVYLAWRF